MVKFTIKQNTNPIHMVIFDINLWYYVRLKKKHRTCMHMCPYEFRWPSNIQLIKQNHNRNP